MNALGNISDWLQGQVVEGQDGLTNLDRLSGGLTAFGTAISGGNATPITKDYQNQQAEMKRKNAISGLMGDLGISGAQKGLLDTLPAGMQQQFLLQQMQQQEAQRVAQARAGAANARKQAEQAAFNQQFQAAIGSPQPQSAPSVASSFPIGTEVADGAPVDPQALSIGQVNVPQTDPRIATYNQYKTALDKVMAMPPSEQQAKLASKLKGYVDYWKPEEAKREMYKGADGFNYWMDAPTERVNPDIQMDDFDADRYRVVGNQLFDLGAEGGPQSVGAGQGQEEIIYGADGQPILVRGPSGTNKKLTEAQSKDNVYATRAKGALELLDSVGAGSLTSRTDRALDVVPLGIGRELQNEDFQVAQQAGDEFLQAVLRKDTGAAITEGEQVLYGRTYLPQPGDGPQVLEAKRASRFRAISAIESGMTPQQVVMTERAIIDAARKAESSRPDDAVDAASSEPITLPEGMDADLWSYMTPEEKALFQ